MYTLQNLPIPAYRPKTGTNKSKSSLLRRRIRISKLDRDSTYIPDYSHVTRHTKYIHVLKTRAHLYLVVMILTRTRASQLVSFKYIVKLHFSM